MEADIAAARHKTALRRTELSRPLRSAVEDGLVSPGTTVFDFGCGHGDDIRVLEKYGIKASGWDPVHQPESQKQPADIVNLGYVVNVIEDPLERAEALRGAWELCGKGLVVAARLAMEVQRDDWDHFGDGRVTSRGTFQKFFQQEELQHWIEEVIGETPVAAGLGIYYVFRDQTDREHFLAARQRRRVELPRLKRSEVLFEEHRALLEPLMDFVAARGRLPKPEELEGVSLIRQALGSLPKAFKIIRLVTGDDKWDEISEERHQDLLVYLALARFPKRPPFTRLPTDLQLDVKAFFGSYKEACAKADEILFSLGNQILLYEECGAARAGKITERAIYFHRSALEHLSPVLRVYEGAARATVGGVREANVIKLHRQKPAVTYMTYVDFDGDPHPRLIESLRFELRTHDIKYTSFNDWDDPPILIRKEEYVPDSYAKRALFEKLTRQEERAGILSESPRIEGRQALDALIRSRGYKLGGHRLQRA